MQFYLFLGQAEANAFAGRQAIRSSYGILDSPSVGASLYAPPAVVNFNAATNVSGATGHLWGSVQTLQSAPNNTGITGAFAPAPSTRGQLVLTGLRPPPASLLGRGVPSNIPTLSMTSIGGAAAP
jgi:hypothetical protein